MLGALNREKGKASRHFQSHSGGGSGARFPSTITSGIPGRRTKKSEEPALWDIIQVIKVLRLEDEISKRRRKWGWETGRREM